MTDVNTLLHLITAVCGFVVVIVLFMAGRSPEFRFRIGPEEHQRSFNFSLMALLLLSSCLDIAAAPLGVSHIAHQMAISLAAVVSFITATLFGYRIALWKL